MHLDEEQVQRLVHGEMSAEAERSAREHVSACEECRQRLADAEREERDVMALLRAADDPPPPVRAEAVAIWAEAVRVSERMGRASWIRRAAGFVLVVGIAGAAYAIPGSPVRAWVHAVVEKLGGRPETPGVPSAPGKATDVSGIAVRPGERLSILFRSPQSHDHVRVSLSDGAEVQVQAPAGAATFTASADQLLIDNRDSSATFEIRIPRSAPWVEVRAGDARIFLKEGTRITTPGHKTPG